MLGCPGEMGGWEGLGKCWHRKEYPVGTSPQHIQGIHFPKKLLRIHPIPNTIPLQADRDNYPLKPTRHWLYQVASLQITHRIPSPQTRATADTGAGSAFIIILVLTSMAETTMLWIFCSPQPCQPSQNKACRSPGKNITRVSNTLLQTPDKNPNLQLQDCWRPLHMPSLCQRGGREVVFSLLFSGLQNLSTV